MRLSEAIREGAKLRPMCQEDYFMVKDGELCSCALGAIAEVSGVPLPEVSKAKVFEGFCDWGSAGLYYVTANLDTLHPELFTRYLPARGYRALTLHSIIMEMNDSGLYTREEIADWLESCGL